MRQPSERKVILIADCGSTKTDWCCIKVDGSTDHITTIGLNPNFVEEDTIFKVIESLPYHSNSIKEIHFYGSGCGTSKNAKTLQDAFLYKFPNAKTEVFTDLVGAARACLDRQKGIIAILGTGSNSGIYDGHMITVSNPSLGHFLGDYGGGVDIGKQLLRDYFYNKMPEQIKSEISLSREKLIDRLYHQKGGNTFIASQTAVIFRFSDTPYVRALVKRIFDRFVREEILNYINARSMTVNFVGSIAFLFQDILELSLKEHGLTIGKVLQKPIDRLKEYHYIGELN